MAFSRRADSSVRRADACGLMDVQLHSQDPSGAPRKEAARVSVVVPSYNHAPFVAETLRSVFKQTRAPALLLVIDDGSRDGSPRVIEKTLNDCPFPCELVARAVV